MKKVGIFAHLTTVNRLARAQARLICRASWKFWEISQLQRMSLRLAGLMFSRCFLDHDQGLVFLGLSGTWGFATYMLCNFHAIQSLQDAFVHDTPASLNICVPVAYSPKGNTYGRSAQSV